MCAVYYFLWIYALPRWGGYRIKHERVELDGGEVAHKLVKISLDRLEEWDREHDAQGKVLGSEKDGEVVVPDGNVKQGER